MSDPMLLCGGAKHPWGHRMATLVYGDPMSLEPSERLKDVVNYVDEVLAGMITRPSMYGTVRTLESEFIRLLEVKEVALGRRTLKDFTPISNPELLSNQWLQFIGRKTPGRSAGLPLSWSARNLRDLSAYFLEFRTLVDL